MNMPSIATRRAGALLLVASLLGGCAGTCPRPDTPPPPGGPWAHHGHGHGDHGDHGGPWRDPAFAAAMQACLHELGADDNAPGPPGNDRPEREALDACLRGKGVALPPRPPRDPTFDAAVQACKATLDLRDPGPPPPESRDAMAACLKDKGVELPPPPPPRH